MDFDPRDYDSRDEERFNPQRGKGRSHDDDVDRDDYLRLPDERPRDRDDDARTLGRGPGEARQSNANAQDHRDDSRWPDGDREPRDRTFDVREPFTRDLNLPRGHERELVRDRDRENTLRGSPREQRECPHLVARTRPACTQLRERGSDGPASGVAVRISARTERSPADVLVLKPSGR